MILTVATTLTPEEAELLACLRNRPRRTASGLAIARELGWRPNRVRRIVRRLQQKPMGHRLVSCPGVGYRLEGVP